jgi:hypothetical protein
VLQKLQILYVLYINISKENHTTIRAIHLQALLKILCLFDCLFVCLFVCVCVCVSPCFTAILSTNIVPQIKTKLTNVSRIAFQNPLLQNSSNITPAHHEGQHVPTATSTTEPLTQFKQQGVERTLSIVKAEQELR